MRLSWVRSISLLLRVLGTVALFFTLFPPVGVHPWIPLAGFLFLWGSAAALDYTKWRCPHCLHHLGKRMFPLPARCPHCHQTLHAHDKAITEAESRRYRDANKENRPPQ